jgi:hypothetical protein
VSEEAYEELPVQGYLFESVADARSDLGQYNGCVCKILTRATNVSEHDVLAMGPAFRVRFGDGRIENAHASELSPWYPTD